MKFNKIFLPFVAAAALFTTACTDEVEYTPVAPAGNDEVYFPNNQESEIALAENATEFHVTIERLNADNAVSVVLKGASADPNGESAADIFSIPSSVQFAEGVKTVQIPVSVNFANIVADTDYAVTVAAETDQQSPYGDSSITLTVYYAPWSEYEEFSKDPAIGALGNPWPGEEINSVAYYRTSLINPNLEQYLIGGPRYSNLYFNFELSIDKTQTYDIDGTTCYKVTMPLTDTHYDNKEDRIMYIDAFTWMRNYGLKDGASASDEQIEAVMAKNNFNRSYYNPETGLFSLWLVPCVKDNEVARYSQSYTYIQLPGFKQYSVELSYSGNFVDGNGIESAIISILKSDDVTSYKYDVVPGKLAGADLEAAVAALKENADANTVAETNYTLVYTPEEAGWYTVVVVAYDGDESVYETSFSFEFDSVQKESEWKSIGYAEYTDDFLTSALQGWGDNLTWDVEVEESIVTPGLYRLVNPYAPVTEIANGLHQMEGKYYMVIDATVPDEVYIDLSMVGLDFDDGDSMICFSLAGNYLSGGESRENVKAAGVFGTLEDGVITFPVKSLLVSWTSMLPNLYYANTLGGFYLDLNSTSAYQKPAKFKAPNFSGVVKNAKVAAKCKANLEVKSTPSINEIAEYNLMKKESFSF